MSKLKKVVGGVLMFGAAVATVYFTKHIKDSYQLELENCTDRTLDLVIGTVAHPEAILINDFAPNEKIELDLREIPMAKHDVIYIRFPEFGDSPAYQRTLIYDTSECNCKMHGMILDYGDNNLDVKLVKRS